ncbi:fungal-specific transcription factor domain-containing protein [Lophiotrema nucula]|uniref:Fungal-specific transcription factor domain-containing protein n=1 Tax=Lophiotrema nucula TaxID=690887 RepID=A0A6A5ZB04_9PLEO|nr:fungal-specific transcription factor domain-containing protein [Lophiotrema nucula]
MSEGQATKKRRLAAQTVQEEDQDGKHEGPACHSCRKKKAKCSRQQPCSNCESLNIECVYDEKSTRPGMRTGAIDSLNRRLATLEQMFIGQGLVLRPLLDRALQDTQWSNEPTEDSTFQDHVEKLKADYKRLQECTTTSNTADTDDMAQQTTTSNVVSLDIERNLVDWYFDHIHPWIPILHVTRFRDELHDPQKRSSQGIVLDAIVSLCLRFLPGGFTPRQQQQISVARRHSVILQSVEKFSVECLQALVIIAFDIIGSGRGPSAWSVVGSMTRTVEQLRLSVEDDESVPQRGEYLIRRMTFLRKAKDWIEVEERRRVFWNVFLMDRFCSIATGWNNSLTSADVRRRLPCEGAIWQAGRPVRTPLFGIAGRPTTQDQALTPASERRMTDEEEVESIGGFAFCIEATESLNLVTSFFLQHPVAFSDVQEMQVWLMRFKELDLRLVKWRLFLPAQWKNASVLNQDGIMDPNLTLAHITHNTAVIQLHQCIAYPAPQWRACSIRLPSVPSSETCMAAAAEISTIAYQFLQQSNGITNPQFSFCLFIAGRVLLAHVSYASCQLDPAFDTILASLAEIGQRWHGKSDTSAGVNDNLAMRFNKRLTQAKLTACSSEAYPRNDATLDIRQPVYYDQTSGSRATSVAPISNLDTLQPPFNSTIEGTSPDSVSLAFPPLPVAFDYNHAFTDQAMFAATDLSNGQQELSMLFDDQYQQLLRVSTFADAESTTINDMVLNTHA